MAGSVPSILPSNIPVFESDMRVPEGPRATVGAIPTAVADQSAIGQAISEAGKAGVEFAARLAHGQAQTLEASVKTQYLERVAELRDRYGNSEDYKNAPAQFGEEHTRTKQDLLAGVRDPGQRATLGLYFAVHGLEAEKHVKNKALANEGDANIAGLTERSAEYVRKAAAAPSAIERQAVFDTWNKDVDDQVAAGWITRQAGVQRKIVGAQTVDDADAMALIRINPAQALEELQNPERFKGLGPVMRQNLINQARAQQDQVATLEIQNVARRDPLRAVGMVGRVGASSEADSVFHNGVIPIESGGRPDAVSSAGALGASQLMPDTARKNARALGLVDVANLSEADLRERLLKDDNLNRTLGLAEWRSLVSRYDGRIYAAAAGYNAGTGSDKKPRADAWVAEAEAKFGPNFSAAQFASVIPIAETKNYVLKLAKQLGAPADGPGLSVAGSYHASSAVSTVLGHEETQRIGSIKAIAAVARETDDPAALYKAGYDVDPARYAAWLQTQRNAAMTGDMTAAKALRDAEFQREMLPFVQKARATPPAQLERLVADETARLANSPNATIDEKNRLDVARETLKSVQAARKDNIIGLAEQARLVSPDARVSIDAGADPGTQGFGQALAIRGSQANAAQKFYGGQAVALKPEELASMKERWGNAQAGEQFAIIQALGKNLTGQAYTDTVAAVMGDDKNAAVIGTIARTRPDLAREILIGTKLLGTKEIDAKSAAVRPALAATLGTQIYPSVQMQSDVVTAAIALYVARTGRSGLYDTLDTGAVEKAVEDITGPIVKRNGLRTPIAPGIAPAAFRDALDHLSEREVTLMGGAFGRDARPIAATELGDRAQLTPLSPGSPRYVVKMPTPDGKGAPVLTYDGSPLIFDMSQIVKSVQVPLTVYQQGRAASRGAAWERMRQTNEDTQP